MSNMLKKTYTPFLSTETRQIAAGRLPRQQEVEGFAGAFPGGLEERR
jgi:hypothetical protein